MCKGDKSLTFYLLNVVTCCIIHKSHSGYCCSESSVTEIYLVTVQLLTSIHVLYWDIGCLYTTQASMDVFSLSMTDLFLC